LYSGNKTISCTALKWSKKHSREKVFRQTAVSCK
jgi:hypothetical protein